MPLHKRLLRLLLRLLYRVDVHGMDHYHRAGRRVLIVANHGSLLDGILLYAFLPETPTFAINTQIAARPLFRPLLRFVNLFVMDTTNPLSLKSMIKFIRADRKAVIFPEGRITITGTLMKVYEGPGLVAERADAAILPVSIGGAQRTPFSYLRGIARIAWWPKITLRVLPPERLALDARLSGQQRRRAAGRSMLRLLLRLTFLTYEHDKTLFAALLEAARMHGWGHVVLEDVRREPLSYRQIVVRATLLAEKLRRQIAPGDFVGVLLPNVSGTVITFFALQYLGAVPAMLNYTAGALAVRSACETAKLKLVLSSTAFIETAKLQGLVDEIRLVAEVRMLEELRTQVTAADKLRALLGSFTVAGRYARAAAGRAAKPAAVLFTSGSEGVPKGVVLSHANILANYAQVRCHIDFRLTDLMFSCLPLFHSFGLNAGMVMPLLGGTRIFLYPTPLHYRVIPELVYEMNATILFGTNTFFRGYARFAHPFDFRSLRYAVAGAEKLRDETYRLWQDKFGIRILQGYGVTETSPVIAVNTPIAHKAGTVGELLPASEAALEPVAGIETGGRLLVRGPHVMLGYLLHDAPGVIQAPKLGRGQGWHDTGDIATIDNEGFVTIVGRARRFAKIGGEMISLQAVEDLALHTWPKHQHAAVNLPDERKGEKIVLVTNCPDASRRQMQETAQQLRYGELFVPKKIVSMKELPLLGTGKTDYVTLNRLVQEPEAAAEPDEDGDN
jgi:acyl-[acyl-carrier-protein]-phospholipid O-acyltransferase/long-chain-fatty-acid--[acyl-carrier-protein] ligase